MRSVCSRVGRASDTVARLGGDEFALVLLGARDGASALFVADRIRRALDEPIALDGLSLELETSIGIAVFPDHGDDIESLMRHADIALYASKEAHAPVVYAAKHNQHSPAQLGLVGETRRAIDNGEMIVHFQPQVDLATGATPRVEALVRWEHPERGLLLPDDFIPIARQSALIRPITRFVLDAALRQCREWQDAGIDVAVAVNLAGRDLADSRLEEDVSDALRRWKLDPEMLELEIPESAVMNDADQVHKMLTRLSRRGVRIAVDDFGSGYASFGHLKQLPVDVLKIDRSFVQNLGTNDEDDAIVRSAIDLAHNLDVARCRRGRRERREPRSPGRSGLRPRAGLFAEPPGSGGRADGLVLEVPRACAPGSASVPSARCAPRDEGCRLKPAARSRPSSRDPVASEPSHRPRCSRRARGCSGVPDRPRSPRRRSRRRHR